jgi:signal transduction histidine kinase
MIAGAQIEGAMLTLTDVTDCKRREVIAREMSISRERGRMAAEIHDTFAQSLNAIVLQLEAAEEDFQGVSFDLAERRCRRACELARDGLRESRRTIWTLSDKPMGNGGLTDALSHMAQMLFHGTSVRVTVSLKPESPSPISDELQYELLRIGRESLTNVWKHANATAVHLEFTCRENEIRLSVCDDGRGFDASPFSVSDGGFGLIGMRVRAEGLGGNLVIESQPGRGTCVLVVVPLQLAEERRIA